MSALSIDKMNYFATNNGYEIHKIFVKDSQCFLIEMMSIHTIEYILVYIPDKYKFNLPPDTPVYPVRELSMNQTKNDDIRDYTHISESLIESSYSDMKTILDLPSNRHKISMSQHLDESYKKGVIVDDIKGNDNIITQDIGRQLRRLKYCIRGMSHKLAIMNAPYFGVLNNQDEISLYECDILKRGTGHQKMYIVIDFKMFYDKINNLEQECTQIFKGIYAVLNNNQNQHTRNIKTIMDRRDTIFDQSDYLQNCQREFSKYTEQYLELLEELYSYEKSKEHELNEVKRNISESSHIHHDMKRTHQKQKLEKELRSMAVTRRELIKTIQTVKVKNENLTISIDNILFDNIVMLDKIFRNFAELDKLKAEL